MSRNNIIYLARWDNEIFEEISSILEEKIAPIQINEKDRRIGRNASWSITNVWSDDWRTRRIRVTIKSSEFDKWKSYLIMRYT